MVLFQKEWVDVVVDDRLPFWPDGRLVFCSNKQEPNEFWCSLLVRILIRFIFIRTLNLTFFVEF